MHPTRTRPPRISNRRAGRTSARRQREVNAVTTSNGADGANALRRTTIELCAALEAKADEFELPKPPEAVDVYRRKLEENNYLVLVAGEANRGKTSFCNSLIG